MINKIIYFCGKCVKLWVDPILGKNSYWLYAKRVVKKKLYLKHRVNFWNGEWNQASIIKKLRDSEFYDVDFIDELDSNAEIGFFKNSQSIESQIESILIDSIDPSENFSQKLYKEINEDVKGLAITSIEHYLELGISEHRKYAKSEYRRRKELNMCSCNKVSIAGAGKILVIDFFELESQNQRILNKILMSAEFSEYHKIIKTYYEGNVENKQRDVTYLKVCNSENHNNDNLVTDQNEIEEIVYLNFEIISRDNNLNKILCTFKNDVKGDTRNIIFWPETLKNNQDKMGYKIFRKGFILPNVCGDISNNRMIFADLPNRNIFISRSSDFNKILIKKLIYSEIDWIELGIVAKDLRNRFVTLKSMPTIYNRKLVRPNEAEYLSSRDQSNIKYSFELEKYPKISDFSPHYLNINGNVSQVNIAMTGKTHNLLNSINMVEILNSLNIQIWERVAGHDYDVILFSEDDIDDVILNEEEQRKVIFLELKHSLPHINSFGLEFMVNPKFINYHGSGHYYRYNLTLKEESYFRQETYFNLNILLANRNLRLLDSFSDVELIS